MAIKRGRLSLLYVSLATIVVVILGIAAYMIWWHTVVLNRRSIVKLTVVEHTNSGATVVHVSGLCGDDGYSIKRIAIAVEGSSITMFVYASIVRPGKTGWFEYDVPVPPSVNEIRFGKDKVLIWRRESPMSP